MMQRTERRRPRRRTLLGAAVATGAVVLAIGAAPFIGFGADHLDAPNFTSPDKVPAADITDLYVFQGEDAGNTVLAMGTSPAAGALSPTTFANDVWYKFNVDQTGDARADLVYLARFSKPRSDGSQHYRIVRKNVERGEQHPVARGWTDKVNHVEGGGRVFAGLRSDPFFFDLDAFKGAVLGMNSRTFCDAKAYDFFKPLNLNGIVLELPDHALGQKIGVWAVTSGHGAGRIDRMGRPAINTVFFHDQQKVRFNESSPVLDRARFTDEVVAVLKSFSALDPEGAYTTKQAQTLASVLLPDMLTYDTSTKAQGPLNGRALQDDVIDAELNLVTGGYPFPGRDAKGGIQSDCVGPHNDYLSMFPYLGNPH